MSADVDRECGRPWTEHEDDGVQMLCPEPVPGGEAVQQVPGGKWHRVWWPAYLEAAGTIMTHVGSYKPGKHPRRPVRDVPESDRCRTCCPVARTPTP